MERPTVARARVSPVTPLGTSELLQLVAQAVFLRQYGERPPGAPRDNPGAETWRDWETRATAALYKALDEGQQW